MTDPDIVLSCLARLPAEGPPAELSRKIRDACLARLVPARVHSVWSLAIAASVIVYLGWALVFTGHLF